MQDRRKDFIIDCDNNEENDLWVCDKVRMGLNLAYMNKNTANKFKFDGDDLTFNKGSKVDVENQMN